MIGTIEYLHGGESFGLPDVEFETATDAPDIAAIHWPDLIVAGEFEAVEPVPEQRTMVAQWQSFWSDDRLILWRDPTLVEIYAGLTGQEST